MAIVVDKAKKRRDIALACQNLLLEHGIEHLTVSQISQAVGVGKGTIYEYFENKEDIVFEIITGLLTEHRNQLEALVYAEGSTREKLFRFCYQLFHSETGQKHLEIYKEFLAISLTRKTPSMLAFSEKARAEFVAILQRIIDEGIARGELDPAMRPLARSLIVFSSGLVVDSRLKHFDPAEELHRFLDGLFILQNQGAIS